MKTLMTVVLTSINLIVYGNGNPVASFSSINCVKNPQPLSIPVPYTPLRAHETLMNRGVPGGG